jgi:hypothetical protein
VTLGACSDDDDDDDATSGPIEDIADRVGIRETTRTYGSLVFDYDSDGWPDILVQRHSRPAHLYRNAEGRFRRVKSVVFGKGDRHRCSAADLNDDERIDLFCAIGGVNGSEAKRFPNELWLQQPDGTFENDGDRPDLADPYGRGRQSALFDMDHDGDVDMFVGNVSPRIDSHTSQNRVFLNEGGARWRSAPQLGLDQELSVGGSGGNNFPQGCIERLDADDDGWEDLLLCAKGPQDDAQRLYLFRNDHGRRFVDVSETAGLTGLALDGAVFDMNDDGQPDIVSVDPLGLTVWFQADGRFRPAYRLRTRGGLRVAVADADGDDDPDIYLQRGKIDFGDVADSLLINRGSSDAFRSIPIPAFKGMGRADDVVPIDHDRDGRWEFLVLNGLSEEPEPVQLLRLRATS